MSRDGDADVSTIPGIGPSRAEHLRAAGYETVADVRNAALFDLVDVEQLGRKSVKNILENAEHDEGDAIRGSGSASKLTRARQEEIAETLERVQSIAAASRTLGITQRTFCNWIGRGDQQNEGPYREFYERMRKARGIGEVRLTETLLDMAREQGDTQILLKILEIRYPESWGDRDTNAGRRSDVNIHLSPKSGLDMEVYTDPNRPHH